MTDPMPARAPWVRTAPFGDDLVLHDPIRHQVHVLNASGALVWRACDGATDRPELVAALAAAASQPLEVIERDLDAHLRSLADHGLLQPPAGAPGAPAPVYDPTGAPEPGPERPLHPTDPDGRRVDAPIACAPILVLDRTIVVRTSTGDAKQAVESLFAPVLASGAEGAATEVPGLALVAAGEGEGAGWRLAGRGYDRTFDELPDALGALVSQVNRVAADCEVLALHAAAVRSPEGVVVLLAGASGAGKSTLAAALVGAGWDYLGDEAIGVAPGATAMGYPKPLSLSPESCELLGMAGPRPASGSPVDLCPPVEVRPDVRSVAGLDAQIGAIVLLDGDGGGSGPASCAPHDALVRLAPQAINLASAGPEGLRTLVDLATRVPTWAVGRAPIDGLVSTVASLASLASTA